MIRLANLARALLFGTFITAQPAIAAAEFPQSTGDVILTITPADGKEPIVLDREGLETLPTDSFETSTIWTEGVSKFEGVRISVLLEALGAESGTVKFTAVNDYAVDIPVADLLENDPIIADKMDGEFMSLRDKGPLWLIYPYDTAAKFQTSVIYARSIWQLDRLQILE